MDSRRFDALAKALAAPEQSRRAALRRLGVASLAAVLGAAGLGRARAQDATPAASPMTGGAVTEFLYVQSFAGGTFRPKPGEAGVYELTLTGGTGHTVYFADRPERQVGIVPTARVLGAIGFDPANPPNAALVAQTADGEDVVVVELLAPRYDERTQTLVYDARVLANYEGEALRHLAARQADPALHESFGQASLFIDGGGCPDPICGGVCCSATEGMVCQGNGAYCTATNQLGMCRGGDVCNQRRGTSCNPEGDCYCGTSIEGGGACVAGDPNLCSRRACSTSGECGYGKLCIAAGSCCGAGVGVCMPLCQD